MNTSPGSALHSCRKRPAGKIPVYADGSPDNREDAKKLRRKLNSITQEEFLKLKEAIRPEEWRALKKHEKPSILRWYSYGLIHLDEKEVEDISAAKPTEALKHPSIILLLSAQTLRKCVLEQPAKALGNLTARSRMGKEGIPTPEECFEQLKPREFDKLYQKNPEVLLETVRTTKNTNWVLRLLSKTNTTWHKAVKAESALKI